jgi:hypothetical protein
MINRGSVVQRGAKRWANSNTQLASHFARARLQVSRHWVCLIPIAEASGEANQHQVLATILSQL